MIIAQISDLHACARGQTIYGVDTNAMMQVAIDAVLARDPRPDCVLVSGDITHHGLAEEYEVAREALARLPMPVLVTPGNHDLRAPFAHHLRSLTSGLPNSGKLDYAVDAGPVTIIALDTLVEGETGGLIDQQQEDWLEQRLAETSGRPVVIMMHHPPFLTGLDYMDGIFCRTSERFHELVAGHPNVERILCGHHHRTVVTRWAGTVGMIIPGTAHQVALDMRPGASAAIAMEPPAIALHLYKPGAGLFSHLLPIGNFGDRRIFTADEQEQHVDD